MIYNPYRWCLRIHMIATCGGIIIYQVYDFDTILPALQPVAAGMTQVEQVKSQSKEE